MTAQSPPDPAFTALDGRQVSPYNAPAPEVLAALPEDPERLLSDATVEAARSAWATAQSGAGLDSAALAALLAHGSVVDPRELLEAARALTDRQFGRGIRLYAPCYLSNLCVNSCRYCGFNVDMLIERRTLSEEERLQQMLILRERGFRRVLLVSSDWPALTGPEALCEAIEQARGVFPRVDLEVAAATEASYRRYVEAGAEGVTCYQETYNRADYERQHVRGPKSFFEFRLGVPERAARAGIRRVGLGILLGLAYPATDLLALAAHARFLLERFPDLAITLALPRLRPAVADFAVPYTAHDEDLVRYMALLRLAVPQAGLVVSTREPAALRHRLLDCGVTQMSAGSCTAPGGYSADDPGNVHAADAGAQFQIADERPAAAVAADLRGAGYEVLEWSDV